MMQQTLDYSARVFDWMPDMHWVFALLITVAIMACFGAVNGCVIAFLKVPPFIATLGMQTLVYGTCQIITGNQPIGGFKESYRALASGNFFGNRLIPYLLLPALLVGLFMWFLYNKTRHGKYMYAIGGNENAAEVSGVNTGRAKILIYVTAGVMYAIAGFLLAPKSGGAAATLGQGYELEAIAGCTIGGVSTTGGIGTVGGVLVGVLVFELLKIVLQFLGVNPFYNNIVQGLVIVVAVAVDIRKYVAKK